MISAGSKAKEPGTMFALSVRKVFICGAILPAGGFVTCVFLSLLFDFESSTRTHCRVRNYLPSISSAIGGYVPQRYIWRICIALMLCMHYVQIYMNYNYYSNFVVHRRKLYSAFVKLAAVLVFLEKGGLVGLSYVSSEENYAIHEKCFIVFIACAMSHMLVYLIVMRFSNNWKPLNGKMLELYTRKRNTFLFNIGIFGSATYLFYRHNTYCEPGVYSLFALCEYLTVLSNVYCHILDILVLFGDREIALNITKSRHS